MPYNVLGVQHTTHIFYVACAGACECDRTPFPSMPAMSVLINFALKENMLLYLTNLHKTLLMFLQGVLWQLVN